MPKPSKKKGHKDPPKQESSQSTVTYEEPPPCAPPEADAEDDAGLTGAARKRKEKKEKKEKALQALQELQASRKPSESTTKCESEASSEQHSRAQSEAPSEPSAEVQSPSDVAKPSQTPVDTAKAQAAPKDDDADDAGLGITGATKKRKPRKKKGDAPPGAIQQAAVSQQATASQPAGFNQQAAACQQVSGPQGVQSITGDMTTLSISGSSTQMSSSGQVPTLMQMPEPVRAAPPGLWGQSAGRGRGRASAAGPPPGMPTPQMPPPGIPTPQMPPQQLQSPQIPPQQMWHQQMPPQQMRPPQMPPQQMPPQQMRPPQMPPQQMRPPQMPPQQMRPPQMPPQQMRPQQPQAQQQMPVAQPSSSSSQQETYYPTRAPKTLEPVLCRYKIPTKIPGGRVSARTIRVLVNYLEMEFKSLKISRYDVSFTPDRPKRMLPEVFAQVKKKFFAKDLIAFDQMKNCYSLKPLQNVTSTGRFNTTIEIIDQNGRTMSFEVSMKATGVVDLDNIKRYMVTRGSSLCHPTEEIQCIDVILRQGALESYVKAGRQFFKRPHNPVNLGYGYEMWTGLFQSAIFTSKAFINIDVAHKGFPKHQPLLDALINDFRLDPTRPIDNQRGDVDYFAAFVKGLKVVALLVGNTPSAGHRREFVCNSIVGPSTEMTFNMETDGRARKITVADYFAKEKKYQLKYPRLNCLWVGSRDKTIYFPIELLTVAEGQPLSRQLNEKQVSVMVKEAATPPDERLQKITETISNMKYSQNRDFKQFGLDISDKFYTVKAKVLDPPVLDVGSGKVKPRNGQWQAQRLLKPEQLQSWGLIAVDTDPKIDYDAVIDLIIRTGNQMGMTIAKPKIVNCYAKMKMLHSILMNAYNEVRFVFIIVSARGRDDYHKVKQLAEREVGILTQCIKDTTARRINAMTAKNILLKVNSKLMGINQAIDNVNKPKCLSEGGVMIVGADVTHPSPDQSNVPSIAAVTASLDPECYIYNIELSIQTPKKEVIVEFEDMMFDHLKLYKERNRNQLPRKIFVFRDGVSEGQFAQVMNSELTAVHIAYQRLAGQNRKPEVLFLLVQKRHHTRLFNDGPNKRYNVEPGTVVDTDIVHASELDFYLVSHQAIKGTARPTRYHAVCNDGKIPDDEVEQLTYYLCHLYSRCMRSVSYPTPTYYAHLACLRARSLTHGERFDNRELEQKPRRLHVLDKMLQFSRMFFV